MRNVEIKAKITNYDNICKVAAELSQSEGTIIKQDDTFYRVNEGRLKMRFYADSSATLVRYDRDDQSGPKLCNYELLEFTAAESEKASLLDGMLKKCLGARGRVVKERKLYMIGQTRVHIDTVQDLGHFMELEVVLRPEQSLEDGQAIAQDLQTKLGVKKKDLIQCAYIDLLEKGLSDHRYIRTTVSPLQKTTPPNLKLSRLSREMADEAAIIAAWVGGGPTKPALRRVNERVLPKGSLTAECEASTPQSPTIQAKKQPVWWTPRIAALHAASNAARRAYKRCRRRRHTPEEEGNLRTVMEEKKRALNQAIKEAKEVWTEVLGDPQ